MKAEPRGKYPGLKLHLDEKECQLLLDWMKQYGKVADPKFMVTTAVVPVKFVRDVAKTIGKILVDAPMMLTERTPDQIKKALLSDQKKISEQLKCMDGGQDWKTVK